MSREREEVALSGLVSEISNVRCCESLLTKNRLISAPAWGGVLHIEGVCKTEALLGAKAHLVRPLDRFMAGELIQLANVRYILASLSEDSLVHTPLLQI
jgi:hypothetical protein